MNISDAFKDVNYIFIDTAPIIYYVEQNPFFSELADIVFERLDNGLFTAVISPVTIAECLMYPIRSQDQHLQRIYMELFINHPNTVCNQIDANIGNKAGEIKARYNLKTPDALQIASALATGCGAFLTNDKALKRVTEIKVLVLQELTIL